MRFKTWVHRAAFAADLRLRLPDQPRPLGLFYMDHTAATTWSWHPPRLAAPPAHARPMGGPGLHRGRPLAERRPAGLDGERRAAAGRPAGQQPKLSRNGPQDLILPGRGEWWHRCRTRRLGEAARVIGEPGPARGLCRWGRLARQDALDDDLAPGPPSAASSRSRPPCAPRVPLACRSRGADRA